MTRVAFDRLVAQVEARYAGRRNALHRKCMQYALLGLGGLISVMSLAGMGGLGLLIACFIYFHEITFPLFLVGLVFALGLMAFFINFFKKFLFPNFHEAKEVEITAQSAPGLFSSIQEICQQCQAPSFQKIWIMPDAGAHVLYRSRFKLLGTVKADLHIGFPLLLFLSKKELSAVLAHECAHLQSQHFLSGQWIYRCRDAWGRFVEIKQARVSRAFISWLWPRLNAHAFVLSRALEYDADTFAALGVSSRAMCSALAKLQIYSRFIHEEFWPGYWKLAAKFPVPPSTAFSEMEKAVATAGAAEDHAKTIRSCLAAVSTTDDTHPCLSERLHNLLGKPAGISELEKMVSVPEKSAAEEFLGADKNAIVKQLSDQWAKDSERSWAARHFQERTYQQKTGVRQENIERLWERALHGLNAGDFSVAEPLLREILSERPGHYAARMNLIIGLLGRDEKEGCQLAESLLEDKPEAFADLFGPLRCYYKSAGLTQELNALSKRADMLEASKGALHAERTEIKSSDAFMPHALPEELKAQIIRLASAEPAIQAIHTARKVLNHSPKEKFYVLVVTIPKKWGIAAQSEKESRIVHTLSNQLDLKGRLFVCSSTGEYKRVAAKIKKIPGAAVLEKI